VLQAELQRSGHAVFSARQIARAGNGVDTSLGGDPARHDLVAEVPDHPGRRPDENESRIFTGFGEVRVLGQKPVSGVNGIRPALAGGPDDPFDVQIIAAGALADENRGVGEPDVIGLAVGFLINHDGPLAEFLDRPQDPQGDFPPVRNEDFSDGLFFHRSRLPPVRRFRSRRPIRRGGRPLTLFQGSDLILGSHFSVNGYLAPAGRMRQN